MATVYLAEDLRHRCKVAVKVLRRDLTATLGSERFAREIEIAAQLRHPHILPVLDSGEAAGFLFCVMPYIEGGPGSPSARPPTNRKTTVVPRPFLMQIPSSDPGFDTESPR
jgi:serine/threonine protein kinase